MSCHSRHNEAHPKRSFTNSAAKPCARVVLVLISNSDLVPAPMSCHATIFYSVCYPICDAGGGKGRLPNLSDGVVPRNIHRVCTISRQFQVMATSSVNGCISTVSATKHGRRPVSHCNNRHKILTRSRIVFVFDALACPGGCPSRMLRGHCFELDSGLGAIGSNQLPTNCVNPSVSPFIATLVCLKVWQSTHLYRSSSKLPSPTLQMPRSCLKLQDPTAKPLPSSPRIMLSLHVHFPPTPSLSSVYTTHSPRTYDRAPIAISPNVCALPERGGRTYTPASESSPKFQRKGSYFHPDAHEACEPEPINDYTPASPPLCPPPLIPDLSSDSDESDGVGNTLPHDSERLSTIPLHHMSSTTPCLRSKDTLLDSQLSFLPHPPSSAKDGVRRRRSPSCPRPTKARDTKIIDAFEQPSLDGCLGGF